VALRSSGSTIKRFKNSLSCGSTDSALVAVGEGEAVWAERGEIKLPSKGRTKRGYRIFMREKERRCAPQAEE
jgi:hypothetical protein